jgi:hypothetical protein
MPDEEWLHVWQNQPVEHASMSIEDITRKAGTFERTIRNRNLREYIAGGVVVIFFAYNFLHFPELISRLGSALLIAGTLYVMYQLHRRGSAASLPRDMGLTSSLAFHRRELVRQRDALASIGSWYLAPMLPGLLVMGVGSAQRSRWWVAVVFAVFCLAVFAGIWWLNHRAAARLSRQIEELDKVGGRL